MNPLSRQFAQILVVLCCSAAFAYSQQGLSGFPSEVVDGRTVKVRTASGQELTIRLRLIAVPGEGDPMAETVRRHLAMHLGDGEVHLTGLRLEGNVFVAGVFVKGVDVSLQMLRDGAAWYKPDADGRSTEGEEYARYEQLAKAEQRGVWSVSRTTATVSTQPPVPASKPARVQREGLNQFDLSTRNLASANPGTFDRRPAAKGSPRESINAAFDTLREMIAVIRNGGSREHYFRLHDNMARHLTVADAKLRSRPIGALFDDVILSFQAFGNAYGSLLQYGAIPYDPHTDNRYTIAGQYGITPRPHPRFGQAIYKDQMVDVAERAADRLYRTIDALLLDVEKRSQLNLRPSQKRHATSENGRKT